MAKRIRVHRNNTSPMQLYNQSMEWLEWFKEERRNYKRKMNNLNETVKIETNEIK